MVTINSRLNVVECLTCGEMAELRSRSPEAHVITSQQWERKHRCNMPVPVSPKKEQSKPDRWSELFANIDI